MSTGVYARQQQRKRIWWDLELNVPMFVKPVKGRCKEFLIRGDVWATGATERRLLATLVSSYFGCHLGVLNQGYGCSIVFQLRGVNMQ